MKKRVFISASSSSNLDDRRRRLKSGIIAKIRQAGYEPEEFWESGAAEGLAWNFDNVDRVMRQCLGAVVLGFPRWNITSAQNQSLNESAVGEFNHYEGAVALTHGLPVLLLKEVGVQDRGIVWNGGGKVITYIPNDADKEWLEEELFSRRFKAWLNELEGRRDIFLGYCSKSVGTAAQIQLRLERLGASVLNWAMDFRAGSSILSELESARARCSYGVFLFSEDDPLEGAVDQAAPRDNVVFEAGYFMSAKSPGKCLIIRHGKAKMPADVGGAIYLSLGKEADVDSIQGRLNDFVRGISDAANFMR